MKNSLLFTIARIHNCWEHHQDGSDLRERFQSHLFTLVFNDLRWALKGKKVDHYWTFWADEYEERSVRDILRSESEFKDYWHEINVLEIIHAAVRTSDGGNSLIDKNHPSIFEKAPKGYFEKRGQVQGFLTSEHKFVDRFEAAKIAVAAGQVSKDVINGGSLTSENFLSDSGFEYDTVKGYYKEEETLKIKTW